MKEFKCIKRRRLLNKYKHTEQKRQDDISLLMIMKGDADFINYFIHVRKCERRCYQRLKRL